MAQYNFKPLSTSFNYTKSLLLLLEMLGKFCSMTFNLEHEEQLAREDCLTCMQLPWYWWWGYLPPAKLKAPASARLPDCSATTVTGYKHGGFSLIPRTQHRSRASGQYL